MKSAFTPTEAQRPLIELIEGCHLVQAPPGTGKTQVLTHRILHLLEREPTGTFRILALTFTTKAAENLRKRVRDGVGDVAERVNACTFHSFCMDALQHYGQYVSFPSDTTIYEADEDRLSVLARALSDEGLPILDNAALKALLNQIGVEKRDLRPPEAIEDPDLAIAYTAYNSLLRRFHACDFDDLMWLTWRLMTENPRIAKHYRRMYRYIMVDEAQDTSRAQYEILRAVCGDEHRNVMMVADSDQFIYRFAGANSKWLDAFVRDFSAQRYNLFENFRCGAAIVAAASRLVENQPGRLPKPAMVPAQAAPGKVEAWSFSSERDEAVAVANWVEALLVQGLDRTVLHPSEGVAVVAEDVCVMCRTRYALNEVLSEFERRNIPHLFSVGRRLVETPEGLLVLQGLRVLRNESDAVTRRRIVGEWAGSRAVADIADLPTPDFLNRLATEFPATAPFVRILQEAGTSGPVGSIVHSLVEAVETVGKDAQGTDDDRATALMADAATLRLRWNEYAGHTQPDARTVSGFLAELALAGKSVIEGGGVRVLTIHVAKGLEFRAVALVGMNEGVLPDYRNSSRPEDLADERRIAYVAVTRASRLLLLTRSRTRTMSWGATKAQTESRFVRDMGLTMEAR